jgi:hypothetical protein
MNVALKSSMKDSTLIFVARDYLVVIAGFQGGRTLAVTKDQIWVYYVWKSDSGGFSCDLRYFYGRMIQENVVVTVSIT